MQNSIIRQRKLLDTAFVEGGIFKLGKYQAFRRLCKSLIMKRGELLLLRRCIIIVLDSLGIGELPDAGRYGDNGSDTLGNIYRYVPGFRLPNLEKLGLGNIIGISGPEPVDRPLGCFGKMAELSPGKDTTTGHWEIAGIILDKPFPCVSDGFPRSNRRI